jgi:hypothetical protein
MRTRGAIGFATPDPFEPVGNAVVRRIGARVGRGVAVGMEQAPDEYEGAPEIVAVETP